MGEGVFYGVNSSIPKILIIFMFYSKYSILLQLLEKDSELLWNPFCKPVKDNFIKGPNKNLIVTYYHSD